MCNEPIQIQVSQEEIRQFIQTILTTEFSMAVSCRPIDQLVTIRERVRERWPAATTENRRRVRDVCIAIYRERLGENPLKLTGDQNGTYAVERQYMDIIDLAIDRVRAEVERRELLPLFVGLGL